jgi:hypothetical protein
MFQQRERRNRVLEALDRLVKQFRTREDLYPLRIPHDPLLLADLVADALGDEAGRFDERAVRTRMLLTLRWDDGSNWELWVAALPSGLKLFCDSAHDETRILASGGRNAGDESERLFLELLGESRGEHFGIEMAGGAPTVVISPIDRALLVDLFVNLFEGTDTEGDIRRSHAMGRDEEPAAAAAGRDFQAEVEWWLDQVRRGEPSIRRSSRPRPAWPS